MKTNTIISTDDIMNMVENFLEPIGISPIDVDLTLDPPVDQLILPDDVDIALHFENEDDDLMLRVFACMSDGRLQPIASGPVFDMAEGTRERLIAWASRWQATVLINRYDIN